MKSLIFSRLTILINLLAALSFALALVIVSVEPVSADFATHGLIPGSDSGMPAFDLDNEMMGNLVSADSASFSLFFYTKGKDDVDPGYQPSDAIGDTVWLDTNGDGVQDLGENGISGVVISLTLPSSTVITTTTDSNGNYLFSGLLPGAYTVMVDDTTLPAPYAQTFDADGVATAHSSTVTLAANEDKLGQDFGYAPEATAVTLRNVTSSGNTATRAALFLLIAAVVSLLWLVFKHKDSAL